MSVFCGACLHNWYAHDPDDDSGETFCCVDDCPCDEYEPADDGSIEV